MRIRRSSFGVGAATITACVGLPKEVRLDRAGETADILCDPVTGRITVRAINAQPEIELLVSIGGPILHRVTLLTGQSYSIGSPAQADPSNTLPVPADVVRTEPDGTETVLASYILDPGERIDVSVIAGAPGEEDRLRFEALIGSIPVTIDGVTTVLEPGASMILPGEFTDEPAADLDGRIRVNGAIDAPDARYGIALLAQRGAGVESAEFRVLIDTVPAPGQKAQRHQFKATHIQDVLLWDDPAIATGTGKREQAADTAIVAGSGTWNGVSGYTFELRAVDAGAIADLFAITIRSPLGEVVAAVNAVLTQGSVTKD